MAEDLSAMFTPEECFFGEVEYGERGDLYLRACQGLRDGDLQPLAAYIEAGYPIGYMLARGLADAIRGDGDYILSLVGAHKNVEPESRRWERRMEAIELGADVWRRVRDARASCRPIKVEHAVEDVSREAAERGLRAGRTKVMAAYKWVKDQMAGEIPMVDVFRLAEALPEEFTLTSEREITRRSK